MLNNDIYITKQGDTFDIISKEFYGEEKYSNFIIQANQEHRATIIFEYGVKLKIPDIEVEEESSLPPWIGA